jgi:BASS family bile acid:Na+ symporter
VRVVRLNLIFSIFRVEKVVLAPIAIGMTTNKFFPNFVKKILPFAPVVGVVSTCLLVASAVAQVAEPIISAGWSLQVIPKKCLQ